MSDDIEKILNKSDTDVINYVKQKHYTLSDSHIHKLIDKNNPDINDILVSPLLQYKLNEKHIDKLANTNNPDLVKKLSHLKLSKENVDNIFKNHGDNISVMQHFSQSTKNLGKSHIQTLIDTNDKKINMHLINNSTTFLDKDHIDSIIKQGDHRVIDNLINRRKLQDSHINDLVAKKDPIINKSLIKAIPNTLYPHANNTLSDENIHTIISSNDEHNNRLLINNRKIKLQKSHIDVLRKINTPVLNAALSKKYNKLLEWAITETKFEKLLIESLVKNY